MKKLIISLLLATTIICSTFTGVFATNDTNPHIIKALSTGSLTTFTNEADPH